MKRQSLLALQRQFVGIIRRPLDDRMALADASQIREDCERLIKPGGKTSALERAEIYNRQYWFRLLECFSQDFPGVRWILGNECFDRLAQAYLSGNPSRSFTLRDLGNRLPEFLEREPQWCGRRNRAALEMARLERALAAALDARELTPISDDGLRGATLRFRLQPHLTLLELHHPLDRYFTNSKRRHRDAEMASNAMKTRRQPPREARAAMIRQHIFLVVHRHKEQIYLKRIAPAAHHLLRRLQLGEALGTAIDAAVDHTPHSSAWWRRQLAAWFREWTALGWLARRS